MRSDDVRSAAAACTGLLAGAVGWDWSVRAGELELSVAQTVAHIARCLHVYAVDLAAGPERSDTVQVVIDPDRPHEELVGAVRSGAAVLAATIEACDDDDRGFHPAGVADPSGFAAMACDELLVHTDDIARGLGLCFEPDAHLAGHVVRRLFPWAPHDQRSWPTLRWANGRAPLGDRPRLSVWKWHSAPLAEWDGREPVVRRT